MTNFDTIRAAICNCCPNSEALTALAELERTHFTSGDVADASAQGFRDGVASVTAGQEIAGWVAGLTWGNRQTEQVAKITRTRQDEYGFTTPIYTAAPVAQQPQAEPHKPLFADMIAKHPGLREELKAMDDPSHPLFVQQQPQAEAEAEVKRSAYAKLSAAVETATAQQAEAVSDDNSPSELDIDPNTHPSYRLLQAEAVHWERKNDAEQWVSVPLGDEQFWAKHGAEMRTKPAPQQAEAVLTDIMRLADAYARDYTSRDIPTGELYRSVAESNTARARLALVNAIEQAVLAKQPQAEAVPQGWSENEIAQAAIEAEISDSKFESFLLALPQRAAPQQAEAVPPTHVLVPVEPTEEIMRAVYGYTVEVDLGGVQTLYPSEYADIYRTIVKAALAAAQQGAKT